jgi:WD40 repeat protein
LYEEAGTLWSLAFSPDGRMLAAARSDGIFLWDLERRQFARKLKGHEAEVNCVRFSPDGKIVASGGGDNTIRLWDSRSGQLLRILKGHRDRVWSMAFVPDGQTLVSGSWDHDVKLWYFSPKNSPDVLRGHTNAVHELAFSPDDRVLATASFDDTIKLWDVANGTNIATLTGHTAGVTGVKFSGSTTLVSCGLDKTIRFWNTTTRQQVAAFTGERMLSCLELSPDGRTLAVGSGWWTQGTAMVSNEVTFWDLASQQRLTNCVSVRDMVQTLSYSPDGRTLAIGLANDSLELVDTATTTSFSYSSNFSSEVAWSRVDGTLAVADEDDRIGLLDLTTRRISRRLQMPSAATRYAACSADGKTMAIFYTTTKIKLCNVATGREVATLQGHESFGMYLAFSHNGQSLASAGNDRTARLWRAPRNIESVTQRLPGNAK